MNISRITWLALLCAAAIAIPWRHAYADGDVVALGSLIARSDTIVTGIVSEVTHATATKDGAHSARIDVRQTLKGVAGASIELAGDYRHPDDPMFVEGGRVLVFLRGSAPAGGGASVVDIGDDSGANQAAAMVARGLRNQWAAANFQDIYLRSTRPPVALLASLLKELATHLTQRDHGLLVDLACDPGEHYLPTARAWAIEEAGRQKAVAARPCLEELLFSSKDAQFGDAAIEALGDLGDTRSVPVLSKVLDQSMLAPPGDAPRGRPSSLLGAVLALGKIGDPTAAPTLLKLIQQSNNLALDSSVVHALGLIGTPTVDTALSTISRTHPDSLIREQALTTLQRLGLSRARRIQ